MNKKNSLIFIFIFIKNLIWSIKKINYSILDKFKYIFIFIIYNLKEEIKIKKNIFNIYYKKFNLIIYILYYKYLILIFNLLIWKV